jgi:hypothetical protein
MSVPDTQFLVTPKVMGDNTATNTIEFNPDDSMTDLFAVVQPNNASLPQVFAEDTLFPLSDLVVPPSNPEGNITGPSSLAVSPTEKTSVSVTATTVIPTSSDDPKFLKELVKTQWDKLVALRNEVTISDAKEAEETVRKLEAYVTKTETKLSKLSKDLEKSRQELEKARKELELKRKRVVNDEDEVNKSKKRK